MLSSSSSCCMTLSKLLLSLSEHQVPRQENKGLRLNDLQTILIKGQMSPLLEYHSYSKSYSHFYHPFMPPQRHLKSSKHQMLIIERWRNGDNSWSQSLVQGHYSIMTYTWISPWETWWSLQSLRTSCALDSSRGRCYGGLWLASQIWDHPR